MGHSEGEPPKPEKSPPPATQEQNTIPVYPDWAAMQAYYGPRFAMPQYSAVSTPHGPSPYLWVPPQSMIPPYGAPYTAFYTHGGFYGHAGVSIAGSAFTADASAKLSGNIEGGFVKKLKEFDGLAKSAGNGNADSGEHRTDNKPSESEDTEGSSDGSNGVAARDGENQQKRSRQGSPGDGEAKKKFRPNHAAEGYQEPISAKAIDSANTRVETTENIKTAVSEPDDPSDLNVKMSPTNLSYPSMPGEAWLQNERELKRERRKQSNRESARRSRLRKQAEMEELSGKVQVLTSENMTLKSEINKFVVMSEKLKLDNITLMEKLKSALKEEGGMIGSKPVNCTQNLLEKVDKKSPSTDDGESSFDNTTPSSVVKLHQLLEPSSHRTDPVAAT